jgi:phage baseplate assembly protein W
MASNREYDNDPDVYIGVKLPIKHDELGFFSKTKTTLEQAEYNLQNLLLTKFGERLAHPTFGCALASLVFEQMDTTIIDRAEEAIREAANSWLPYLSISDVEPVIDEGNNRLNVKISYSLKNDRTQINRTTITYDGGNI